MSYLQELGNKCCAYFTHLKKVSNGDDHPIKVLLNQYDREHPGLNAYALKAAQYEILAEHIEVKVFEETPFYFINDITWCPGLLEGSRADWLYHRNLHIYKDADLETWRMFNKQQNLRLFLCCGLYCDTVHYTVPVENLVKYGMLAIKKLCYEDKIISLKDYLDAVRMNWEGKEDLLHKVRHCPHFGDHQKESLELAQRLHLDLCQALEGIESEHGGRFFLNYYVYREFFQMSKFMRATPDGRRDGEMFAQGIGPSKYHAPDSLTDVVQSVCYLDQQKYVTGSLDIQLPLGKMTKEQLAVLLRTFAGLGVKHLQLNCVSVEALKAAQIHPEQYQDLIVRVTGFSAKFVALSPEFQEEMIKRHVYGA